MGASNGLTEPPPGPKAAVETYLEQVKIVTALATTLLLTPNVLLTLEQQATARQSLAANLPAWETWLIAANVAFLSAVILTYFIYATVVGDMDDNKFDVYRPATRWLSLAQLVALLVGCVALFMLFKGMM